jgi:hypothetical protein
MGALSIRAIITTPYMGAVRDGIRRLNKLSQRC